MKFLIFLSSIFAFLAVAKASTTYGVQENNSDINSTLTTIRQSRSLSQLLLKRQIVGIELIQISGVTDFEKPESWFGHSAIRFVEKDANPLLDLVVSFEMVNLNSAKIYQKGLRDGWASYATVTDFATYIGRYSVGQSRSIRRMPIPATPQIIQAMKLSIVAAQDLPDLVDDYNFFKNNCATGILRLLGIAGLPTPKIFLEAPALLDHFLRNSMVAYLQPSEIPQFQKVVLELWADYQKQYPQEKAKSGEELQSAGFQEYLSQSTEKRKMAFLVYFWPSEFKALDSFRWYLAQQFREALQQYPVSSFVTEYPQEFYVVCRVEDMACRQARLAQLEKTSFVDWVGLGKMQGRHKFELERSEQLVISAQKEIQTYLKSSAVLDLVELSKEIKAKKKGRITPSR